MSQKNTGQKSKRDLHDLTVNKVVNALNATGLGRFWKQETGAAYRNNHLIYYGVLGGADISGIMIGGTRVECEIKTGKGVQRDSQKAFESMIKMFHGIYFVSHSAEDAVMKLNAAAEARSVARLVT